ncbi:MAG TPA: general secretion pathway protein GspB [Thermodesulfovibrionales bacterium]|nr:general secretion pathway protein GspB [Thermodesulfovibrionales bacterium]
MSYILDALKKSEKQRQRGAVPDVLTVQDVAASKPKTRLLWPYLLAAVVLLNAGLFVWWSASSQSKKPNKVEQAAIQKQDERANTPVPNIALSEKKTITKSNPPASNPAGTVTEETIPTNPEVKPEVQTGGQAEKPLLIESGVQKSNSSPTPSQAPAAQPAPEAKPTEAVIPPPENRIYSLFELPSIIRQGLPQFSISTHVHSGDPTSRLIRINGQTLREGQELSAGLRLEEITSDGVIFAYQNYRFRVGVR